MRCAIVGSGIAALAGYATLRHGGVQPEEIAVFGTHDDPTAVWRERTAAIRQTRMRSESDGHLGAASFPGLAVLEAWREWTLWPIVATAANRYHPLVSDFLAHADRVVSESGFRRSFVTRRVQHVRAVDAGFEIDGDGPFPHVLLATGHAALQRLPGTVHAYEPHEYAAKVAVVGAGMAAATEWLNALGAGADVVSLRRREPLRRPLNVPRPYFSKRGLGAFHRLSDDERAATLRDLSRPSYPPGPEWDVPLARAEAEGRMTVIGHWAGNGRADYLDFQVIAATGFKRGWQHDALLSDLVAAHDLETRERWIVVASDSTVPSLTDEQRTLSLAGVAGQWAFPASDTIAGAKYAARAFLRRVCRTR